MIRKRLEALKYTYPLLWEPGDMRRAFRDTEAEYFNKGVDAAIALLFDTPQRPITSREDEQAIRKERAMLVLRLFADESEDLSDQDVLTIAVDDLISYLLYLSPDPQATVEHALDMFESDFDS